MAKPRIVNATPDQAEQALHDAKSVDDKKPPRRSTYKPQRARAGQCARSASHVNTRIYKTVGSTRCCVCDDCGKNWKQTGQPADDLGVFALRLAESLDEADRVDTDEGQVIVMDDSTAKQMETELRKLAQS